jgi:hypothetical protein
MGIFVNFLAGISESVAPIVDIGGIVLNVPQNAANDIQIRHTVGMVEAIRPRYVLLDSGGFQLLQKELDGVRATFDPTRPLIYNQAEVNLTPYHVIEAVCRIKPDIMVGLDKPVLKISGRIKQDLEFKMKMGFNVMWMRETAMLRNKHCPSIRLLIPVQCYNLEQFSYLEKHLVDLAYNGIALPTRNLDAAGVSTFLIKFYQMGIRQIHILSYSSFIGIALSAFFARHVFEWCSIDATSWRKYSDYLLYCDPMDLTALSVNNEQPFDDAVRAQCPCPWCSYYTAGEILNMPETNRRAFLRNHNSWTIEKLCQDAYENSRDLITLERHLKWRAPKKIKRIDKLIHALSIVENFRDEDISLVKSMLGVKG